MLIQTEVAGRNAQAEQDPDQAGRGNRGGELTALMGQLKLQKIRSIALIKDMTGTPLTKYQLRNAFDRARNAAVAAHPKFEIEIEIRNFQFRDLRAKAGTDTEDALGIGAAQGSWGIRQRK